MICLTSISLVIFLKVFFRVKTSEVEEIVIEKWYNRWLDLLTMQHVLARAGFYIVWSPWYFGDFCNIFLPNRGEDQINVSPSELRAPGTVPYGKSAHGCCIMFIKNVR